MDYKTSTFLGSLLNKSDLTPGVDITRAGVVYLNYVEKIGRVEVNKMLAFDIIENKLSIIPIQCSCSFLYETITDISHPAKFYIHPNLSLVQWKEKWNRKRELFFAWETVHMEYPKINFEKMTHQLSHSGLAVGLHTFQELKHIICISVNYMHSNGRVFMMLEKKKQKRIDMQ